MITGVVQAGSSLGILIPPSVVMVLYGMIARQPVSKLWFINDIHLNKKGNKLFAQLFPVKTDKGYLITSPEYR